MRKGFTKAFHFRRIRVSISKRFKFSYYENLVKVFYTNLEFTAIGDLSIQISSKRIEIRQMDWMNVANLRYDDIKLTPGTILEGVNYDRAMVISSMIREQEHGENVRNVGSLNMNDKLLHYT